MTDDLTSWTPRARPGVRPMPGAAVLVEPITDGRRLEELADAFAADAEGALWRFMGYGPFPDRAAFLDFAQRTYLGPDAVFHAIVPAASGRAEGVAALMRIDERNGVIELGQVCLAPSLQRSRAATEAYYLILRRVFEELGYRRLEWKCDTRNRPSRQAAERLGFGYEGTFRQHMVVKGCNRDTAWYTMLDRDWPRLHTALSGWLEDGNFNNGGRQRRSLRDFHVGQAPPERKP